MKFKYFTKQSKIQKPDMEHLCRTISEHVIHGSL